MSIGSRIKKRREEKNISLSELARQTDVSKGYLSSLESENAPRPSADTLYKIARVLGTTVADLLGEKPDRAEQKIPESLRKFAEQENLTESDVKMLAAIEYRGERPETEDDWRFIYESIKRTIQSKS